MATSGRVCAVLCCCRGRRDGHWWRAAPAATYVANAVAFELAGCVACGDAAAEHDVLEPGRWKEQGRGQSRSEQWREYGGRSGQCGARVRWPPEKRRKQAGRTKADSRLRASFLAKPKRRHRGAGSA